MDIVEEYHEKGFCLVPSVFSREEIDTIKYKVQKLSLSRSEQRIIEIDNSSVRSLHGLHIYIRVEQFSSNLS